MYEEKRKINQYQKWQLFYFVLFKYTNPISLIFVVTITKSINSITYLHERGSVLVLRVLG